jgi:hypothetical protein
MEIKTLLSKKRNIFALGDLPFDSLFAPANREKLQKEFNLDALVWGEKGNLALLQGFKGQFLVQDRIRSIMEINIQPSSLEVIVEGETEGADLILSSIESLMRSFSITERPDECKPREVSYETFCVCRFENDGWWQISAPYAAFVRETVLPKIADTYPNAIPVINPGPMQFRIQFKMKVASHLIAPKALAIELREGTSPEDRIFWSTSPLRSEEHMEMLRQYEMIAASN